MSGPAPVTTRVGGGMPPRVAGLIAIGVLGAVVWVGVSGRPPAPSVSLATSGPAAKPTVMASPTHTVVAGQPSDNPSRAPILTPPPETPEPMPRGIPFAKDKYAVFASIDERLYRTLMAEIEPGRFRGSFRVLLPADSTTRYDMRLTQLWSRGDRRGGYVEIGAWPLYLAPLKEGSQASGPVLQAGLSAQPDLRDVPRAVQRGFTIIAHAESRVTYGIVRVEIEFLPRPDR